MTHAEALEILKDKSYRITHAKVQEAIAVLVALINSPPKQDEKKVEL